MLVIVGLIVLLAAVTVGITGVLTNAGAAHLLTDHFAVLGYDVTGSTGTLFLYGIVVGAVAGIGFSVLLAGAVRAASRGRDARRELERCEQDALFTKEDTASGTVDPAAVHTTSPHAETPSASADEARHRPQPVSLPRVPYFGRRSAQDQTDTVNDTVKH